MTKHISLLILLSYISLANAGLKVGNGGDAVVCFENTISNEQIQQFKVDLDQDKIEYSHPYFNSITSVELLEFYEQPLSHTFKEANEVEHPNVSINKILSKINASYPSLGNELSRINTDLSFILNGYSVLEEINDEGELPELEENCIIMQLANQKPSSDTVFLSLRLYNRLSVVEKTGLYLHEILQNYFEKNNIHYINGAHIRKAARYLMSDWFMEKNSSEVIKINLKYLFRLDPKS